jgi:hypothetical protein
MTTQKGGRMPNIEDVLEGAGVLAGKYAHYDVAAARGRIARRVAAKLQEAAATGPVAAPERAAGAPRGSFHAQAAHDLRVLSHLLLQDPQAARGLARLVNDSAIEPDGALVFACMLYLTGRRESAQFWWQFAAGAGSERAAYCLYLHHRQRGELKDAMHWFHQTDFDSHLTRLALGLDNTKDLRGPDPYRLLDELIGKLHICRDNDYGAVLQPDPDIAKELNTYLTAIS